MLEENLETIHYPSFTDLKKYKVSLPHEETSQMEKKWFCWMLRNLTKGSAQKY